MPRRTSIRYVVAALIVILPLSLYLTVPQAKLFANGEEEIHAAPTQGQWTPERAWKWYHKLVPIRGVNFEPSTAVNDTDIWQAETFDLKTIDQQLSWAHDAGYNNVRVFLQYLVWEHDPAGFKQRMSQFLQAAAARKIRVMPVLFDDCSFALKDPYVGKQDDPIPGVHNSQWTPSPGHSRVTNRADWPKLEAYIKDIVGTYGHDRRVLIWDLYNEPGNDGMGDKSMPLVEATFAWAREAHPSQPLTVGVWEANLDNSRSQRIMQLSDVLTFHGYSTPVGQERRIEECLRAGRPVICTEWLHRQNGNTFAAILPLFAQHDVGWYHSCLVAGKTQAYMHWNSPRGTPVPKVWQHCVFHPDGTPYDPSEMALIKNWKPMKTK